MKHLSVLPRVAFLLILAGFLLASSAQGVDSNGPIGNGKEVRLNGGEGPNETDGTIDLPFEAGTFGNGWIVTSALQPDHKLLIGGLFKTVRGVSRQGIARLNEDGTLDQSFDPGTGDYTEVERNYTAIVRGVNDTTGIALIEVYGLSN